MDWTTALVPILVGLAVVIPLIVALVRYVKKSVKERNWPSLLALVRNYMEQAEIKFSEGADRKEWVMAMVKASANSINYEIDMDVVSDMIDGLCAMSKIVNAEIKKDGE